MSGEAGVVGEGGGSDVTGDVGVIGGSDRTGEVGVIGRSGSGGVGAAGAPIGLNAQSHALCLALPSCDRRRGGGEGFL